MVLRVSRCRDQRHMLLLVDWIQCRPQLLPELLPQGCCPFHPTCLTWKWRCHTIVFWSSASLCSTDSSSLLWMQCLGVSFDQEQILLLFVDFVDGYFKVSGNVESVFCRLFPHDSRTKLSPKPNKQSKSKNATKGNKEEGKKEKKKKKRRSENRRYCATSSVPTTKREKRQTPKYENDEGKKDKPWKATATTWRRTRLKQKKKKKKKNLCKKQHSKGKILPYTST